MKLKKKIKKLNPFKRLRAKSAELKVGDVIYTPLYGIWRHYGIVTKENQTGDHTVRTVHKSVLAPIDQTLEKFSDGKRIYRETTHPSDPEAAQRAYEETEFSYNLFLNNCENFVRRAQGKKNVSMQVLAGLGTVGLTVALAIIRRRLPRI